MPNYKIVDADKLDSDLSTLADSIRAKSGTSETLAFPDGMKQAVDGIQAADPTIEDGLITGTLTGLVNNRVTSVPDYKFYNSKNLISVDLPTVKTLGAECFAGCSSVAKLCFPLLETMGRYVFSSCSMMKAVDLGVIQRVGDYAFNSCKQLKYIVLRGFAVLPSTAAVGGTPFAKNSTGGTALVPRARIEEFQTATNWSTLYAAGTCTFLPLEDYTVDGTTTGEIDWDKIEGVTE